MHDPQSPSPVRPGQELPPAPPGLKRAAFGLLLLFVFGMFAMIAGPFLLDGWREHQILENGEDAIATIIVMRDTKDRANENPIVAMTVEVQPDKGKAYRAQIVTPISIVDLQNYRVGNKVRVRFDPADRSKVALVGPIIDPATGALLGTPEPAAAPAPAAPAPAAPAPAAPAPDSEAQ